MRKISFGLLTAFLLSATVVPAEVVINRYDGPLPDRDIVQSEEFLEGEHSIMGSFDKTELPSSFYVLPIIKIDPMAADGDLTLLAIRNEDVMVNTVTVEILSPGASPATVVRTLTNALLPKEVWTLNLRNEASDLPIGEDGLQRGWARIGASDGTISADYFQLDPANDFAAGSRPVDFVNGEICEKATARFLVGGGFTGGTKFFFLVSTPNGSDPNTDLPSVEMTAYSEDGVEINTFEIFSDEFAFEVDAADIVDPGTNFGSIDFQFDGSGGYVHAEYKANNRFSVSVKGVCLEPLQI